MADLVAFLRARLDDTEGQLPLIVPGGSLRDALLDDIAAKRRIVEAHESLWRPGAAPEHIGPACKTCSSEVEGWPCTTLRLLALPFAGRPGYDERWRP